MDRSETTTITDEMLDAAWDALNHLGLLSSNAQKPAVRAALEAAEAVRPVGALPTREEIVAGLDKCVVVWAANEDLLAQADYVLDLLRQHAPSAPPALPTQEELTIREAQSRQPWTVPYARGVEHAAKQGVPHILASHTALHAAKSVGKLATVFEALDHSGNPDLSLEQLGTVKDMSADLLTAALRFANLYGFDLAAELERRVLEKNGVALRQHAQSAPPVAVTQELAELRERYPDALMQAEDYQRRAEAAEAKLAAAWEATGVAGQVKGLTTLDDVVRVQRQDLVTLRGTTAELEFEVGSCRAEIAHQRERAEALLRLVTPQDSDRSTFGMESHPTHRYYDMRKYGARVFGGTTAPQPESPIADTAPVSSIADDTERRLAAIEAACKALFQVVSVSDELPYQQALQNAIAAVGKGAGHG